jgi:hypothetical protein
MFIAQQRVYIRSEHFGLALILRGLHGITSEKTEHFNVSDRSGRTRSVGMCRAASLGARPLQLAVTKADIALGQC